MQDFTRWQSSYSVGNWVLDNQHREILGLCKQAIDCVPDGSQGIAFQFHTIRHELVDVVDEHFGTEEALLRNCRYPLLQSHKDEHADLQVELSRYLMSTAMGSVEKTDFHHFLSNWWFEHILSSDKKFSGLIQRVR